LIFTPSVPLTCDRDDLLGFEFGDDGDLDLGVMVTSHGRQFFRHYQRTSAGHVLMLLDRLGFADGEDISDIEQLVIIFYFEKQPQVVRMKPHRLLFFHDQQQLDDYYHTRGIPFTTKALFNAYLESGTVIIDPAHRVSADGQPKTYYDTRAHVARSTGLRGRSQHLRC
jgi:hypothetical protein